MNRVSVLANDGVRMLLAAGPLLILAGCTATVPPAALPDVVEAHSLGTHYVVITFAEPAGAKAEDVSMYSILDPVSQPLQVLGATLSDDGMRVILTTGTQQGVEYGVALDGLPAQSNVIFVGSVEEEPYLQTAISLSNTEILLTFSTQMDRVTAENTAYYEIADFDGDTDVDVRITDATLGDDYTTVVLTTNPQEHVDYTIRVTNLRRRFSCEDDGRVFLDTAAQGNVCGGNYRPLTPENSLTDFVITARADIATSMPFDPDAEGGGGSVATSANGAGVKKAECGGDNDDIGGGNGNTPDEELIFVPDAAEVAENIVLGVRDLDFGADLPVIFLSSDASSGFDYTIDWDEIEAAFSPGITAGDIVFADFTSLPEGLMVDAIKIRETNGDIWVHSVCGLSIGGRLIDPTRNTATFLGIPPVDKDGPQLLGATSTTDTSVLLSFSEPLSSDAADPTHFSISPELTITDVQFAAHDTQIVLTTLPQVAGELYTVTVSDVTDKSGNLLDPNPDSATFSFEGGAGTLDASTLPRVVGAASTGNTSVMITFSKAMSDSALSASNYFIVQENVHPEAGALIIVDDPDDDGDDPVFLTSSRTAVGLTTLSQNEVSYVITAVNTLDQSGNQLAPPELLVNPSTAAFAGTPFACEAGADCQLPDSDGDGLSDADEMLGWVVTIQLLNGEMTQRDVTSDPFIADTDQDGLGDAEERSLSIDPRDPDSDADELADCDEFNVFFSDPADQDTDGDHLDDQLEIVLYRTSPVLADTDGDGFMDDEEVLEFNRNPRIADLPRPAISVGNMNLEIDERYTTTTEQGETITLESSSSVTMAQSQDSSFASSETDMSSSSRDIFVKAGLELEFSKSFVPDVTIAAEAGVTWKTHDEHTTQFSAETTSSAQQVFEQSMAKGQSISTTTAVTREVVSARVDVDVTVETAGDIAFTVTNLEISILQSTGLSRTDFTPVATLLASTTLLTGEIPEYNLGPFTAELGPFIFSNREIFPAEVDDLLREPRGLIFKVANFDVVDEFGRNFAFASQAARDRTAGLTIDFGNGSVDRFLVAIAGAFDVNNIIDGGFQGGFDPNTGVALGLSLDFILQDTLELEKNGTTPDGILAGPDGEADSLAQGDDIQLIPLGTFGLTDDAIVITAGTNGVLDTIPSDDDVEEVTTGYATSLTCSIETDEVFDPNDDDILINGPGFACDTDSDCPGAGTCTGREVLARVENRRLGDFNRVWAVFSSGFIPAGADFGTIVLEAGDDLIMAFIQDVDRDGLFAREEYLYGSSDTDIDTDDDGISDFAEVREGWDVGVVGAEIRSVLPDPRVPDSDGDGLEDLEEQDLRVLFCRCSGGGNDTLTCGDDDDCPDGSCACGKLYRCDAGPDLDLACSSDANCEPDPITNAPTCEIDDDCAGGEVCDGGLCATIVPCSQDTSDDAPTISDVFGGASPTDGPLRSDPRNRDTDDDGVFDMDEIATYLVGVSIRDPDPDGNNLSDTQALSDDVQKVFVGNVVGPSQVVVLPGPNGELDSVPGGDDVINDGTAVVTNPLNPDDDGDTRPDGQERDAGSDPTDANDSLDFLDSDLDGLSDAAEEDVGWTIDIGGGPVQVFSSRFVADSDFDGLPDLLEREISSDPTRADTDGDGLDDFDEFADFANFIDLNILFPGFVLDGTDSLAVGTLTTDTDTDNDGRTDFEEVTVGWLVLVGGEVLSVMSSPLLEDTDLDGLDDHLERLGVDGIAPGDDGDTLDATNPENPDTDGDGSPDGEEVDAGSNPLVPDLIVDVCLVRSEMLGGVTDGDGNTLWSFSIDATVYGAEFQSAVLATAPDMNCDGYGVNNDCEFGGALVVPSTGFVCLEPILCTQFSMEEGDELVLFTSVGEWESCGDVDVFNCLGSLTTQFAFSALQAQPFTEETVTPLLDGCTEGTAEFTVWLITNPAP